MYDPRKLDEFWKRRDEYHAEMRKNGWDGEPKNLGRDVTYACGHKFFAGWGIKTPKDEVCYKCITVDKT